MQRTDRHRPMDRQATIDFNGLAGLLRISQPELAKLVETPHFPPPIDTARRGIWRRTDIQSWLDRARVRQQMTRPQSDGPRAA